MEMPLKQRSYDRSAFGTLDEIDRLIVTELQAAPRLRIAELGRRVGLSPPAAADRLRRLEESGVLSYRAEVDPRALGYTLFAIVRISPVNGGLRLIPGIAREVPNVTECYRITGEDCYFMKVHLRSIEDLEPILDLFTPHGRTTTSIVHSAPVPTRPLPVSLPVLLPVLLPPSALPLLRTHLSAGNSRRSGVLMHVPRANRLLTYGLASACVLASVLTGVPTQQASGATTPRAAAAPRAADVVRVSTGLLRGLAKPGFREFLGIPYAAPPVGTLRWHAPEPAASWRGVRAATRPGPECPQAAGVAAAIGIGGKVAPGSSENCLYLNVWVPDRRPAGGAPVLVWIHGGSYTSGAGADYDASYFMSRAAGPMIVVTVNYRLGALGFLADQAFQASSGDVGNYGLMDQQAALRWVRRNIGAFGGNPRRVTVAGESAGAISVCSQLAAPGSAGLFHAAIMESGGCEAGATRQQAETSGAAYAASLGCAGQATAGACLRALPLSKLIAKSAPAGGWNLVSGTPFLPVSPVQALIQGRLRQVSVLNGSNHNEMALFVYAQYGIPGFEKPLTAAAYPAAVAANLGLTSAQAATVVARYPASAYPDPAAALSTAWTDDAVCPILPENAALARHAPVYQYQFDDPHPPPPPSNFPLGAYHASELAYLWQMSSVLGLAPLHMTPAQKALSVQMVRYWSQFVISGDPDPSGQVAMPRYQAADPRFLSLRPGGNVQLGTFAAEHDCGFWSSVTG